MPGQFADEVLRINGRYLTEFVEAFDVCPFATATRTSGALHRVVVEAVAVTADSLLPHVLSAEASGAQVVLLILPRFAGDPGALGLLVDELRRADEARANPAFALAPFHPASPYSVETARQLVLFFRRSPDPTIQLVRFSALEAARRAAPGGKFLFHFSAKAFAELAQRAELSLSDRIADENHRRSVSEGIDRLQAVLDDISADRARAYARF